MSARYAAEVINARVYDGVHYAALSAAVFIAAASSHIFLEL